MPAILQIVADLRSKHDEEEEKPAVA